MTHAIVNQYGRYLMGREYDAVVDAVMKDTPSLEINGKHVAIVSHTVDKDGNKITKVEVST